MNRFCKAMSHLNSTQIDEKIKFLDKQLKKTGIVLEAGPTMGTGNIYQTFRYDFTPELPEIEGYVPDSTGFTTGDSTQDANDGDESDSDTWENGWNNTNDMKNSNNLNGETNRIIPYTPDFSGWDGSGVSANNRGSGGYAGIGIWTISSGLGGGKSIGTIDSTNHFIQILVPDNIFSSYNYPADQSGPLAGGYYGSYTDPEFAVAQSVAEAYEDHKTASLWVSRKVWVNFDQATATGEPSYPDSTLVKKQTTNASNGQPLYWTLKTISVLAGARQNYISQTKRLESSTTTLLTQRSLDDPSVYPGNPDKFMDFLRGALDVGKTAFDWLLDNATPQAQIKNALDAFTDLHPELRYAKDIADSVLSNKPVNHTPTQNEIDGLANNFDLNSIGETTEINSEPKNYSDDNFYVDDKGKVHQHTDATRLKYPNNTSGSSGGSSFDNPLGAAGQAQYQIVTPDDGSEPYLRYTDYAYHNLDSKDPGEVQGPVQILANTINGLANQKFDRNDGDDNTGAMKDYNSGIRGVRITGPIDIPISQLPNRWDGKSAADIIDLNKRIGDDKISASPDPGPAPVKPGDIPTQPSSPYLPGKSPYNLAGLRPDGSLGLDSIGDYNRGHDGTLYQLQKTIDGKGWIPIKKAKNKGNTQVAHYEPQGELISEGWESPKYTYVDKDQQKRWFKEKDILPVYPKKAPPKMVKGWHPKFVVKLEKPIPVIKVSKKDLERSHTFKPDEVEELMQLVKNLNDYIKRNPDHLAYARVRYPKHDPRLAALNYKLDMQLAAADEYVETRFPENERLFDRLMKRTKESIKLTNPKTYENNNGKLITFNKLARIDDNYQPRKIKVKKKPKMSQGKLFLLPDRKKKDDILKDKMAVLDKEIQKTMPEA